MAYTRIILFICAIVCFECRAEDTVTQTPGNMSAVEGQSVTLHCKYSTSSSSQYLFWYIQYPNDFPRYVLRRDTFGARENADEFKGRFDAFLNKTSQTVPLTIQQTELCDSAVYYCALSDGGVGKLIFGNGTKVIVQPKKKSETAAFVLGSDEDNKKGKARACLITDFSSHNINVTLNDATVSVDPSVIEGEEQYSVVAFLPESKERSNFNCNVFVNGTPTEGNNTDIENVCVSDLAYVFESDEKLNSLSLMVLGLRVIFLKSIVFNVLMTVRAWMS